jgi:hypothetical protein
MVALLAVPLGGCRVEPAFEEGEIGVWRAGLTLADAGGCSTAIVAQLSKQLIDVMNCLRPNVLESFAGTPNISISSNINPYLEPPARQTLLAAVAQVRSTLTINSAFRTLAQQFLLKKWEGGCGIQIAATPGNSNHETGLAIDTPDRGKYQAALESRGWRWYGPGDAVHFDYVGPGAIDLRADSVLAFQRLWNFNNPNDRIAEDGDYGPETASRLAKSPTDGFPKVPVCEPPVSDGGAAFQDGGLVRVDGAFSSVDGGEEVDGGEGAGAPTGGCSYVPGGRR